MPWTRNCPLFCAVFENIYIDSLNLTPAIVKFQSEILFKPLTYYSN